MKYFLPLLILSVLIISAGCEKKHDRETEKYITQLNNEREKKDEYMRDNPNSPFNYKEGAEFTGLKYYQPAPEMIFKSKLTQYGVKDTLIILGTKGEEREIIRYGFLKFDFENKERTINVYKSVTKNGKEYFSIRFTDETTGEETYGVGRYLEFVKREDPNHIYTLDFNLAYNPYCAYNKAYSCAIPREEDHLDFAAEAGEKKYHE